MGLRISLWPYWFEIQLFEYRFDTWFFIEANCGHNSTRHLVTIFKKDGYKVMSVWGKQRYKKRKKK
jgi:hypothetical protein